MIQNEPQEQFGWLVVVLALAGVAVGVPRGVWAGLTNLNPVSALSADLLLCVIWFGNGFTAVLFSRMGTRTTLVIFIVAAAASTGAHALTVVLINTPFPASTWLPLTTGLLSNLVTAVSGGALGILFAARRKRKSALGQD